MNRSSSKLRRSARSPAAALAAACRLDASRRTGREPPSRARRGSADAGKKILILGGTGFLGPHIVAAALARGHTVTLFNRGKTHPGAVPRPREAARRSRRPPRGAREPQVGRGRRSVGLRAADRQGVGGAARAERRALRLHLDDLGLRAVVGRRRRRVRAGPHDRRSDRTRTVKTNYGALKALCEQAAEAAMPGRVANIRPGPDRRPRRSDRAVHALAVAARRRRRGARARRRHDAGAVHRRPRPRARGSSGDRGRTAGTFNALGPAQRIDDEGGARRVQRTPAATRRQLTWVDAEFLEKQSVHGWRDMPMWIDNTSATRSGFGTLKNARARREGPDVPADRSTPRRTRSRGSRRWPGRAREGRRLRDQARRELEVLAAWKARKTGT